MGVRLVVWASATIQVLVLLLFVLFVVLPYFGNGLQLQSDRSILGGLYDPRLLPPFNWFDPDTSDMMLSLSFGAYCFGGLLTPVSSGILLLAPRVFPEEFTPGQRIVLTTVGIPGLLLFCSACTVFRLVPQWLMD